MGKSRSEVVHVHVICKTLRVDAKNGFHLASSAVWSDLGGFILTDGANVCRDLHRSRPRDADQVPALVFGSPRARNVAHALVTRLAKGQELRVFLIKPENNIVKGCVRACSSIADPPTEELLGAHEGHSPPVW